jgi:hypothetical protein
MPNTHTKPRAIYTHRLGDHLRVTQAPETCPACRMTVKPAKATRRWNKANNTEQHKFGYCRCGHLLVFPDSPL